MSAAFPALEELGWDAETASWFTALPGSAELIPGRVGRVDKGLNTVLTTDGPIRASWSGTVLTAVAADAQSTPCTGDWVALRRWPDDRTTLDAVAPRRTRIVRADVGGSSRGQVLASNVDVVAVVAGLHPEPNLRRIERFLALAWDSGAQPAVILTKSDLVTDAVEVAEDVAAAAPGVEVLVCSAETGDGVDAVRALLAGHRTMAMLGVSGAGKSSLVNALAGVEVLAVRQIRADGKGRHTSVRRELVPLPGGGVVIDTPGLRGIGLQDAGDGLAAVFADIEALVASCKFTDCRHLTEPDCAVRAALDDGTLPYRRYESWQKLQREAAWMARRADLRRRADLKKSLRARGSKGRPPTG